MSFALTPERRAEVMAEVRAAMDARTEAFEYNDLVLIDGEWWQDRKGVAERIATIPAHIYGSRPALWPWAKPNK